MAHRLLAAITAAALATGGLAACKSTTTSTNSQSSTATNSSQTSSTTKTVPDFTGMGLQSAQDKAQADGFYNLASHDALGRDRHQILDRDWKVCSQKPAAGTSTSTDSNLDFGAVKLDETCPAKDQTAPTAAGATMPDFRGKAVKVARGALDSGTSITVTDASGDGRFILVESNWKVCTQKPKPGAKLNGQPVQITAVKFDESCP